MRSSLGLASRLCDLRLAPRPRLCSPRTRASSGASGPIESGMASPAAPTGAAAAAADINALGAALLSTVHRAPAAAAAAPPPGAAGTFVSPISISLALVLLVNGAAEGSAVHRQLMGVLAKGEGSTAAANARYEALVAAMHEAAAAGGAESCAADGGAAEGGGEAPLTLSIATSLWARPPLRFQPAYQSELQARLAASAHALTGAAGVNEWVSRETRGRIPELVDEGAVARAVAVLASAVYFKGAWQHAFDAAATRPAPFRLGSGAEAAAPTMFAKFQRGQAGYVEREGEFQGVRLPYKGGAFNAVALLPHAGAAGADGAAALARRLAGEPGLLAGLQWARPEVLVWLPRFKLECSMSLKSALGEAGVTAPFAASPDFSRMLEGESRLVVDEVVHKVFIEVNERGTEAAAATGVLMMRTAMPLRPPPEVRFDRPFVFGVEHAASGAMLFLGVVEKPETAEE
ncbi:hypothetical protein Rsub_02665 [Raphidocelis subcapitata]|uniref:Serpin domain-containing protein n=1 Tax=Raphidocelis subcapitata TaxID=307507 RepID=A0A2V0NQP8_9CHLO|nr:hypothetical protein Rsub_02665 [Raphidocelis subcapitata]|eukprot:GBF89961.1 hypothetical protein Rsub_02665 [Raphidocelis subcapitata]